MVLSMDSNTIYEEWLYIQELEQSREIQLFHRDIEKGFVINEDKFIEGKGLQSRTLKNQLFL